jgi:hypothetical protein
VQGKAHIKEIKNEQTTEEFLQIQEDKNQEVAVSRFR